MANRIKVCSAKIGEKLFLIYLYMNSFHWSRVFDFRVFLGHELIGEYFIHKIRRFIMQRSFQRSNRPEAFLTIHRNRLKIYQGENLYLENGQEFAVELDNRTSQTWLAKIKLNGEWTDESGLILRPGEHYYLDTPNLSGGNKKRFKFETYDIPKSRGDLVQDNGIVEIFFYAKEEPFHYVTTWISGGRYYDGTYYSNTICDSHQSGDSITLTSNCNVGLGDPNPQAQLNVNKNTEETGRVELGSHSNQNFQEMNMNFSSFYTYETKYHILPVSKKNIRPHEIKNYCTDCGRRRRKNDKFCPSCGNQF